MSPSLAFTITPADVGARVMVRQALPAGGFADAVGDLLSWEGGVLRVRRRDGSVVYVDEARLVAGKRVPPPPARRKRIR